MACVTSPAPENIHLCELKITLAGGWDNHTTDLLKMFLQFVFEW